MLRTAPAVAPSRGYGRWRQRAQRGSAAGTVKRYSRSRYLSWGLVRVSYTPQMTVEGMTRTSGERPGRAPGPAPGVNGCVTGSDVKGAGSAARADPRRVAGQTARVANRSGP